MSFGSTPNTFPFELFVGLGALAAISLLALIGAVLRWLLGIRAGYFTLLFTVFITLGTVLGLSLYLDTAGQVAAALITKKQETIHYRREGDWRHQYEVWVSYALADGSAPSAHFTTNAAIFDRLQQGSLTQVRSLSLNHWINLVRFADQSTWTWIPWWWLGMGIAIGLAGVLGWQLLKVRGGWVLIGLVLLVLAAIPFMDKYNEWRAARDPNRLPLSASGIIEEVQTVTELDPFPDDGSGDKEWETAIAVTQPYAIVVVRYTPQGYVEPILGVDAVDIAANAPPPAVASRVDLAYGVSDPRIIRLPHHTREHYLRNPMQWLTEQIRALALVSLVIVLAGWAGKRWQRFVRQRLERA